MNFKDQFFVVWLGVYHKLNSNNKIGKQEGEHKRILRNHKMGEEPSQNPQPWFPNENKNLLGKK